MIHALVVQRTYKSVSMHTKMKHKILYGGIMVCCRACRE